MKILVKLGSEEPKEFTVAREAKDYVDEVSEEQEENLQVKVLKNDDDEGEFSKFDSKEGANEFIDARIAEGEAE